MFEAPLITETSQPEANKRPSQAKEKRFEKLIESVKDLDWDKFVEQVSGVADLTVAERRREILAKRKPVEILGAMSREAIRQIDYFASFRGHVFESLANEELNNEEENSVLGNFILKCLRDPKILGLGENILKNPDHLGVVVDTEKNIAYITGMYEVKLSSSGKGVRTQITNFYQNLQLVATKLNEQLVRMREQYGLEIIPKDGVELRAEPEIEKFVFVPQPTSFRMTKRHGKRKDHFEELGWGLRNSVFSHYNIERITIYLMQYYKDHKEEVDGLRETA